MSQIDLAWGAGPSPRYEELAARFRPLFSEIAKGAIARELSRTLPVDEIRTLKQAGFGALRLPEAEGGFGASIPELANLLIELSEADSNITQALRGHFGFVEDVVGKPQDDSRKRWVQRIAAGEIAGNAWTEIGDAKRDAFSTRVSRKGDGLVVNGTKYYTTGSLFADWIDVGATGLEGEGVVLQVRRDDPGVDVVDDWDGFGQTLTASGTTTFTDVAVDPKDIVADQEKFRYGAAFYQIVHLATLAGIGRAIADETAAAVGTRKRHYSNAAGPSSREDPQVLQVVGRIRSHAYCAGAIVLQVAAAIERAYQAHFAGDADAEERANAIAELETSQALNVVTNLVLEASTLLFDTLGASAVKKPAGLDRHWRNARTLSSHNPRIYKDRIIGDYAVNGTPPPYQWRIGKAPS
ncbi:MULTISPECIES: acyl-CoA dehydrogenase family protein [unclassified Rhizobium]|uniref:acyl-CoA dehydrogenase family protein n=1 Tax=Rhizobium sp. PP-CC-3G-465 TaxID=2135648 RepID=UPI000D8A6533|nr:alkylation response protein AidB-like acyl-CoA dehydrogenase [Rhizobium sp. PP-WC-1G-195]TCQ05425.1 alkylation response protein AidB-like acyl-CoA dehydrogenase [Rhizobium sp. PP-F2F-G36]TCQ26064.1 alkylation response protein AidB-like acyl-CoA dehydrogenase [Rhizobium sp. PP-CC-3G-465]